MFIITYITIGATFVFLSMINGSKISKTFRESKSLEETFGCIIGLVTCIMLWPLVVYKAIKNSGTRD